jgi:hypothetical protein
MATRLYEVLMGGHVHLVEAATQSQAIHHVVKGKVSAKVLSALDTAKFMAEGHKVEKAGKETGEEE